MWWKPVLGAAVGGAIGLGIGLVGRCSTGACPLTSSPLIATLWGAALGLAIGLSSR
jgi:hypothetical protein